MKIKREETAPPPLPPLFASLSCLPHYLRAWNGLMTVMLIMMPTMMMIIPGQEIEQKACRCFTSLVSWVCIARECYTSLLHVSVCTASEFIAPPRPCYMFLCGLHVPLLPLHVLRDGPLANLGGGGCGEVQNKFAQGKIK